MNVAGEDPTRSKPTQKLIYYNLFLLVVMVISIAIRQQRLSRLLEFLFKTKYRVAYLPLLGSPGDGFYLYKIQKSVYKLAFPSEVNYADNYLPRV